MRSSWLSKLSLVFGPRPPLNWLLLCLVSVLALIAVLGSSSSSTFDSLTPSSVPDIYINYRRLKEQAAVDYLELRSLSLGGSREKELGLCGRDKEHSVPCYNVSANLLAGYKDGEEFDRHCEVSRDREQCLVRPPKDYKIPLRWPAGRDVIWSGNVKITKDQFLSSGSMTKRLMLLEENQISFHSEDGLIFDGVKDYSRQIAEMLGLSSDSEFPQAGVHTVLDIGCGFGSFGAHLVSLKLMAICIAAYEATGSQVQLALERGLPAMIGNFITRQLPHPHSLKFPTHSLSLLSHSILFHTQNDMALSTGLITSTTFLSGETSSLAKPSLAAPSSSALRFAYANFPANLRMPRTPTPLAAVSKQAATTPREPRGIMKPRKVSPEMQALVGVPEISRTQALKLIWAHIKGNNLQDPENKRIIVCDDKLKKIFAGKDRVGFLEVAGLITPHFL